jgi:hypothetical protein
MRVGKKRSSRTTAAAAAISMNVTILQSVLVSTPLLLVHSCGVREAACRRRSIDWWAVPPEEASSSATGSCRPLWTGALFAAVWHRGPGMGARGIRCLDGNGRYDRVGVPGAVAVKLKHLALFLPPQRTPQPVRRGLGGPASSRTPTTRREISPYGVLRTTPGSGPTDGARSELLLPRGSVPALRRSAGQAAVALRFGVVQNGNRLRGTAGGIVDRRGEMNHG